jgi:hypothetical protein
MLALASASNLPHRTLRYNLAAEPGLQRTFAIGCRDEEGSFVLGHVHPWEHRHDLRPSLPSF